MACSYAYRVLLLLLLLCVAKLLLLLQPLLLAAAVRHRVPDDKNCCWFAESDSSVFFLVIKHDLFLMYPLAVLSYLRPGFAHNTSSVITGIRGAKGGRQPAAAKTPCIYLVYM